MIKKIGKKWISLLSVFLLISVMCVYSDKMNAAMKESQKENLTVAVNRAVTNYYAINGVYPENIESIAEQYGIHYDESEYSVKYMLYASNIYPDITIVLLK
ncbi:MAG: hypothetical protein PUB11_04585 [Oscillospiraceae bacterium]|nr:hypothetical protein [Oscillospiraceae bacterium]